MRIAEIRLPGSIPPLIALVLTPCAFVLGQEFHWTPGAASLLLMFIPIYMASLVPNRWGGWATSAIAAGSSLAEGWIASNSNGDLILDYTFPVLSAGAICGLRQLLTPLKESSSPDLTHTTVPSETQDEVSINAPGVALPPEKAAQCSNVIVIPALPTSATTVVELIVQSESESSSSKPTVSAEAEQTEADVDDPQLLLTLQEVGWRVATDFDLSTLYQTVRHTTQRILRCDRCSVMLWSPQDSTLVDAIQKTESGVAKSRWANRGMLGWVTKNRKLLIRADFENDSAMRYLHRQDENHIEAIAPLTAGGELLGVLTLEGVNAATPHFRRMLQLLANVSALAIKNARLFQKIAEMARRDGLTGLLNHATFQERLRELVEQAQCQNVPLTIIMSDVDRFKLINDNHGHPVGDHVLREVGRIWRTVVPTTAVTARYGGEEFICAVLGMDLAEASSLAEELRHTIETLPISFERGVLSVTASFGVAQLGRTARNATELVRVADEALYKSKQNGRNQVTLVPNSIGKVEQEYVQN